MTKTQERTAFAVFASKYLGATTAEIEKLMRLARRAERLNEINCNREMSDRECKAQDKTDADAVALVAEIAARTGVKAVCNLNGDPRGYAFKIRVEHPDQPYNTWGGSEDGWGVPS